MKVLVDEEKTYTIFQINQRQFLTMLKHCYNINCDFIKSSYQNKQVPSNLCNDFVSVVLIHTVFDLTRNTRPYIPADITISLCANEIKIKTIKLQRQR